MTLLYKLLDFVYRTLIFIWKLIPEKTPAENW